MSIPHYLPPEKRKYYRRPVPSKRINQSRGSWGILIPLYLLTAYNLSMSAYLIVLVSQHN